MKPFHVIHGGGGQDESLEELIRRIHKLVADSYHGAAHEPLLELNDREMAMMNAYRACSPSYQCFLLHLARNEPIDAQLTGGDERR